MTRVRIIDRATICRGLLISKLKSAPAHAVRKYRGATLSTSNVFQLVDGTKIELTNPHCSYCARAQALVQISKETT